MSKIQWRLVLCVMNVIVESVLERYKTLNSEFSIFRSLQWFEFGFCFCLFLVVTVNSRFSSRNSGMRTIYFFDLICFFFFALYSVEKLQFGVTMRNRMVWNNKQTKSASISATDWHTPGSWIPRWTEIEKKNYIFRGWVDLSNENGTVGRSVDSQDMWQSVTNESMCANCQ